MKNNYEKSDYLKERRNIYTKKENRRNSTFNCRTTYTLFDQIRTKPEGKLDFKNNKTDLDLPIW